MIEGKDDEPAGGYIEGERYEEKDDSFILVSHGVVLDVFVLDLDDLDFCIWLLLGVLVFGFLVGREEEDGALAEEEEVGVFEFGEVQGHHDEEEEEGVEDEHAATLIIITNQ